VSFSSSPFPPSLLTYLLHVLPSYPFIPSSSYYFFVPFFLSFRLLYLNNFLLFICTFVFLFLHFYSLVSFYFHLFTSF
jgi:hypothetical protein